MMTKIIGMTLENAIAELRALGLEHCLEIDHDDNIVGITVGCPFSNHYIANVEDDVVIGVREWVWA